MKIGILHESKYPPDRRVPLIPEHIKQLKDSYPDVDWVVQSSPIRAYSDEEFHREGIPIVNDISDCDILFGVKEVDKTELIPEKTYLFFSHTAKMQSYNRSLLQKLASMKITMIDYEYLVQNAGRVVAFGYWAGIVGAYNGILGYGLQTDAYKLKPANKCRDLIELKEELKKVEIKNPLRIVVTGEGRVASGAIEILEQISMKKQNPEDYLHFAEAKNTYCQIGPRYYTKHKNGKAFDFEDFVRNPENYVSTFLPFTACSDMFIACHFWDNKSPIFFTREQMRTDDFKIRFIADVSCDIRGPIPTTLRASTIEAPFYGVEAQTGDEIPPFRSGQITVMAVDNLPGELPRDASRDFGNSLKDIVIPELLANGPSQMIENATILKNGKLTKQFAYLKNFLEGD